MAQKTKTETPAAEKARDEERKNRNIAEYLQSPRRKRKNFVVMAMGSSMRGEIPQSIVSFIRSSFSDLAITHPRSEAELRRMFPRQIVLLIFDDEFLDMHGGLALIKELKEKKNGEVPVLFLTRRPDELVNFYNDLLLPYHELDEYVAYPKMPMNHILSKVRAGLMTRNRRRSRRYPIDIPMTFSRLSNEDRSAGRILDLSVHGAYIKAGEDQIFRLGDQATLYIPIGNYLPSTEGDFLRLSARVRRVYVSGNHAGLSFEHLTEKQRFLLAKFLTGVVNSQVSRQGRMYKTRQARSRN